MKITNIGLKKNSMHSKYLFLNADASWLIIVVTPNCQKIIGQIANPGVFPPQITPESIKEPHESYPYNLKIAEALYKSTLLENWGSGAKCIIDACREQGVEEPEWRWDGGFVIVTFKRPNYKGNKQEDNTSKQNIRGKKDINTPQAPPKHPLSTPQVETLIEKMGDSYMTLKEIAELCGVKDLKYFRESYITPALKMGVIERLYPEQLKHPKQKYRLSKMIYNEK